MSKTASEKPIKIGGDQKRKAERKAAKAAAKLAEKATTEDVVVVDPKVEKREKRDKAEKALRKEEKAARKEKKEEKRKEVEERHAPKETETTITTTESAPATADVDSPSKKRKREGADGDLEIDILLPQPSSKKLLRKIKKHPELAKKLIKPSEAAPKETFPEHASQSRTKFGVWIGNLSFQTSAATLEDFFAGERSGMDKDELHRINLPTDPRTGRNKGFAYVDFKTEEGLKHALTLNEELVGGRRVLIKNSKDFSNRPAPGAEEKVGGTPALKTGANLSKNPPSRILYVGNLEFSCTAEHVKNHFEFAGKIQKVRMATFEDTGKCKGFAFVDFEDQECVKRAMMGLSEEEEESYQSLEGKAEMELAALRRKRGTLGARPLTLEYGQDSSVRYKKRFGGKDREGAEGEDGAPHLFEKKPRVWKDNRSTDAGAAYSSDVRRTGAITAGEGKKIAFD